MLEVEGKVLNIHVSILIDSGSSLSYIASKVVEKCKLSKEKQKERRVELQGEFKKLRPFMFDGEFEEAIL